MATPTHQQVHIDRALTNISIAYTAQGVIGQGVFPGVPVNNISDKYFVYDKADWLRREVAVRAPGGRAVRGGYRISTGTYTAIERAIAQGVPDETRDNADAPLQPLRDATMWVTDQLMLEVESNVAADVFGTGWASSATPSPTWDNDSSEPLDDVQTANNTIVTAIGREPNTGVLGRGLWRHLLNHPDIVDRIKYSAGPNSPATVTLKAVAALFGLDKLLVGAAVENTTEEGTTASMSFIWGNHMFVGFVAASPSLLTPSAGYVFTYQQRQISRFREEQERQDVVEGRMSWDVKLTATDAGYLIKSAA